MYRATLVILICIVTFGCGLNKALLNDEPNEKKAEVALEFRFAETSPGDGRLQKVVSGSSETVYLNDAILFSNQDIKDAYVEEDKVHGPVVGILFKKDSAKRFGELTKANVCRSIAILLDGQVISVNTIQEPIFGGRSIIDGHFSSEEAEKIAKGLLEN